ncbi:MAG: hypothetical protein DI607_00250 [Sphingomonas hengshuiensis]|nr:MAG: hypothetical protein DI607_00250 [Sphingomonas hengshuiensis]
MDDLETTIVITPAIPLGDMTPLERLVLSHVFDAGETAEGLLLYSDRGAASRLRIRADELTNAYFTSRHAPNSDIIGIIAGYWRRWCEEDEPGETVDVDLTDTSWEFILKDIVARSTTLSEIRVVEWYRHLSQNPDSFGANLMLIIANEVAGRNSDDFFEEMRAETEIQRPAEGHRRSHGVPDLAGADPAVKRMRDVIDLQRDGKFPSENFILDPRGHNSLTRIRRFVESFGAPVPVEVDKDERRLETTLACWEAMLDFNDRFMNDEPISQSVHKMVEVWALVGPLGMRRWAIQVAGLALKIHNHLRERLVGPPTPFDHDFVPAVIEVLSWTQVGPALPGSTEEAALKVLGKLADYREKHR